MTLNPEQIHINYEDWPPSRASFRAPSNEPDSLLAESFRCKPSGGLWTSSPHPEYFSNYGCNVRGAICMIAAEGLIKTVPHDIWQMPYTLVWQLKVMSVARIAIIDSLQDWRALGKQYGWITRAYRTNLIEREEDCHGDQMELRSLNVEAIAQDYDAIHMTEKAVKEDKFSAIGLRWWHSESTYWMRWMFDEVQVLGSFWPDFPRHWHEQAVDEMKALTGMRGRVRVGGLSF